MDAEDERLPEAPRDEGLTREATLDEARRGDAELEDALLRRLDRIVALAGRRGEAAPHGELLDELRGLVRDADRLQPEPTETPKEVVERPARRLHGT
jgi:hypothetical protein